jgi:anti-sigma regulatory factor (Ser/Thr protein kinase)
MTKGRQNLYFLFQFTIPWVLLTLAFTTITHLTGSSLNRGTGIVRFLVPLMMGNLAGVFLLGGMFLPILLLARKLNFESNHNYFHNFLIHLAHGAVFLIFQLAVYAIASGSFAPEFWARYPEVLPYIKGSSMGNLSLMVTFYAVIVFAFQTYFSRLRYAEDEKRTAQLRSELVQAQLQALKMQIQPHFLFNTLNSISSLVLTNPPQAHQMIAQLGDFLRLTLDYGQDQIVTLAEELRFLRSYLEIEQIRFSDRLKVNFDIEPEVLSVMVPHMVLQPIVENSIKHAVSHRKNGGFIEIKAGKLEGKLRLQIKDNGSGEEARIMNSKKEEKDESPGTGLVNVQNRLKHFYDNNAGFEILNRENEGTTVTLVVPLDFEFTASRQS